MSQQYGTIAIFLTIFFFCSVQSFDACAMCPFLLGTPVAGGNVTKVKWRRKKTHTFPKDVSFRFFGFSGGKKKPDRNNCRDRALFWHGPNGHGDLRNDFFFSKLCRIPGMPQTKKDSLERKQNDDEDGRGFGTTSCSQMLSFWSLMGFVKWCLIDGMKFCLVRIGVAEVQWNHFCPVFVGRLWTWWFEFNYLQCKLPAWNYGSLFSSTF